MQLVKTAHLPHVGQPLCTGSAYVDAEIKKNVGEPCSESPRLSRLPCAKKVSGPEAEGDAPHFSPCACFLLWRQKELLPAREYAIKKKKNKTKQQATLCWKCERDRKPKC